MDTIHFFGYGALRSSNKIYQVINSRPEGIGALLEGYRLAYQVLDQIPEPAKSVLQKVWGNEFRAYTLRKQEGVVSGVLWEISKEDFQKIKEWEFIGVWREVIEVDVKTSDGKIVHAFAEKVPDVLPVSGFADGLLYNEYDFIDLELKEKEKNKQFYNHIQLEQIRSSLKAIRKR